MKRADEFRAGLFVVVGLFLFALTIYVMGRERQIFARQEEYLTTFKDVKGLSEGAPVRLGGITVGRVSRIGFSNNKLDTSVHVTFLVSAKFLDRLHSDSTITIETQGLLGDRFLSISPGKDPGLIPAGSVMQSSEAPDLAQVLSKAGTVVDNTVEISENVNQFVKEVRKETLADFTRAAKSIAELTQEIQKGDGFLHRLVYSKKDGENIMQSLSDASKTVNGLVQEIKTGKGFLNALIYEPTGADTMASMAKASEGIFNLANDFSEITQQVKSGNGLAHHLIYSDSPEGLEDVVKKLNETAENLRKASEAISQGSGTLGALLVDSQLYDNLVEVTDGAKRSFLLRQAIRSSLDK